MKKRIKVIDNTLFQEINEWSVFMKKIVTMFILLSLSVLVFSQTVLTPKKKKVSPQFEKLAKYELTNNNEPVFPCHQYGGITLNYHLDDTDEGLLCYASQGQLKGTVYHISTGTIIVGYSGNQIVATYFIFDKSDTEFGIYCYEVPAVREFLVIDKSAMTLDELIEKIIEDQTDKKWIKDEL